MAQRGDPNTPPATGPGRRAPDLIRRPPPSSHARVDWGTEVTDEPIRSTADDARRRAALLTILQIPGVIPSSIHIRFGWERENDRQRPLIATYDITTPHGTAPGFHEFTESDAN